MSGASSAGLAPSRPRRLAPLPGRLRTLAPGLALVAGISVLAIMLAERVEQPLIGHQLIEALVLALLLGVVARTLLARPAPFTAGAGYAAKQVLELGVGLLGASVDFHQVAKAGPSLLVLTLLGVAGGIAVSFSAGRALGLNPKLAILVAVGNSICGNSAIAAVAPVIRADKKDVASSIALTAVLGVCLVLTLPLLIPVFGLSHYQYGVLTGMSVYAVPQVVAAAFPVSQLSGQVATLVKLTRVVLLGPVVLCFALLYRREGGAGANRRLGAYLPWFVALFFALAIARTAGWLPGDLPVRAKDLSRILTILAMAGLGFGVELAAVRRVGPRVGSAVVVSLCFMAGLTLVLIHLLRISG